MSCKAKLLFTPLFTVFIFIAVSGDVFARRDALAEKETPPSQPQANMAGALDEAIHEAICDKRMVGAVVLVYHDGKSVYRRAAGFRDREANIPMQEDAIFRLAAITKAYTSIAAGVLISQGKLNLDDPVTKWLPDFTPALPSGDEAVITVRHLMSHTAGMSYAFQEKKDGQYRQAGVSDGMDISHLSLDENLRRIASVPLLFEPGTNWRYSISADVLGAVVASANGTSLPEAMRQLVTEPLGIKDTGFTVTDKTRLAPPYYNDFPNPQKMSENYFLGNIHFSPGRALDTTQFPSGGSGMVGTADDLIKLMETIRREGVPLIKPEIMREMNQNQIGRQRVMPGLGFGMGWAVILDPEQTEMPMSPGTLCWGGVYGSMWFVDPAKKLSCVVLTNTTLEGITGKFIFDIASAIYANLEEKE